jgi:hypothetical protein
VPLCTGADFAGDANFGVASDFSPPADLAADVADLLELVVEVLELDPQPAATTSAQQIDRTTGRRLFIECPFLGICGCADHRTPWQALSA